MITCLFLAKGDSIWNGKVCTIWFWDNTELEIGSETGADGDTDTDGDTDGDTVTGAEGPTTTLCCSGGIGTV